MTRSHNSTISLAMAIADRKERALREREKLMLEHADAMLRESGYLGLNLDEVARRIEYSKATIYNHFKTKEDILKAVMVDVIHYNTARMLLAIENAAVEEAMLAVLYWRNIHELRGEPIPEKYPLQEIWERNPGLLPDIQLEFQRENTY